jgi:hypothetical protein
MKRSLLALAALGLCGAATLAQAGPPPGGGRYVGPPGVYPGGGYRPFYPGYRPVYPGYRPVYPGWRAGYWGPGYWGPWPYAWGAAVALPYAVAPLVVNAAPPAPVIVQAAPEAPASSYWYYCTQPAGYFPYVQQCSQPWMKVVPQVPGSTSSPPQLAP